MCLSLTSQGLGSQHRGLGRGVSVCNRVSECVCVWRGGYSCPLKRQTTSLAHQTWQASPAPPPPPKPHSNPFQLTLTRLPPLRRPTVTSIRWLHYWHGMYRSLAITDHHPAPPSLPRAPRRVLKQTTGGSCAGAVPACGRV